LAESAVGRHPHRVGLQSLRPDTASVRPIPAPADKRLPPLGTILTRAYKGQLVQVQVLTEGFAYGGRVYASLSAVAKAITGSHTNGFLFFRNTLNHTQENA
jgi:hypothetical protein